MLHWGIAQRRVHPALTRSMCVRFTLPQPFMVYLVKSLRSGLEQFQRRSHKPIHAGANPCLRNHWGYSSVGRASALQAECRRFDSVYLHHLSAPVAQLAEQQILNLWVVGSIPARSTILMGRSKMALQCTFNAWDAGSSPVAPAMPS